MTSKGITLLKRVLDSYWTILYGNAVRNIPDYCFSKRITTIKTC